MATSTLSQSEEQSITPRRRNAADKNDLNSISHPSVQTRCAPKSTSFQSIGKRLKPGTAKRDKKQSHHCPRRPNDYYVDAEGQVDYDHPPGWHPDDDEHEQSDASDEHDDEY